LHPGMNSEPSNLNEDGIPSFREIVEKELSQESSPPITWQGVPMIPEGVLTEVLPQYEKWEFLGSGGMGVVYKAWHRDLLRWAAIKFLSPHMRSDPRAIARFQNEAALLAQLRHPSIVPVHDFGCQGEMAWLVMDFVAGVPLHVWSKEKKRKPAEIVRMMAKIARAVGVAHASGITHRDLKPGNILVMNDAPVLLDFGLAQNPAWQHDLRLTQFGELAGTVAYLAPEQVEPSLGEPSPATDVHACGVMLFEMLAGRLPRTGLISQVITRLHQDDQPPRLSQALVTVRRELDAICWSAMQRSPEQRYANGISLAEDLERFLDGRPVRARNPDLLDLAYQYVRRYPWVMAALLVALLALTMAAWSTHQMRLSHFKDGLLSQINRQLTEPEWTPDRLAETEGLLAQMHRVDPVLENYLKENVIKRTHSMVMDLMEAPRLSEDESKQMHEMLHFLLDKGHHQAVGLMERWQARETAWQTVAILRGLITRASARNIFRPEGWEVKSGQLVSMPPAKGQTWSSLLSEIRLDGSVEVEAEFSEAWQQAAALGVNIVIPMLKEPRFYIYQADRFAQHQPNFDNPEKASVMAIMSEKTPLVYALLPREVRESPHLIMRCRYENGDLALSVNGTEPLRYSNVFELARPLAESHFSVFLPVESALTRLEVRQRLVTAPTSPFIKADDLVSIGQAHEALAIYEKYLNRADVKMECMYKYAACLEVLNKPADAIQAWEQVAGGKEDPWKSLAMYHLWRIYLGQGKMDEANAWFDLLMAGSPPEMVRTGIPTSDRLLLNQHYLPITRSINCLKIRQEDMADLDRAVRVQQFLGADERQIASRTALAFHFAGQHQRARQFLSQAVTAIRPSASLSGPDLMVTLICLDHWASLGSSDGDALLQATVTSWLHALKGSEVPGRAIPWLEDVRHELRLGLPLKKGQRDSLDEIIQDRHIMPRHRVEASLIAGLMEPKNELRQTLWKQAIKILDSQDETPDSTQQKLHGEFIVRSLAQSWTPDLAAEWVTSILGKARPLVTRDKWIGPVIQSLAGQSLAKALNQVLANERGRRFALDYALRKRPARELAHESMRLILMAIFSEGSGAPLDHQDVRESASQMVEAFCAREFTEISLMQFFTLWSGVKSPATWEMMTGSFKPALRRSLAALMASRYQKLGQKEQAEFFTPLAKENPAPEPTQDSQ